MMDAHSKATAQTPFATMATTRRRLALLALLAASAVTDCSRTDSRILRLAVRSAVSTGPGVTERILFNVCEGLVTVDSSLRIQPALATSWTNPTDTTWRFELRAGVRLHDGRLLTARDAQSSVEWAFRHPERWATSRVPAIEEVRIAGEHQIEIETAAPTPLLLPQLAGLWIQAADSLGSDRFVCTGPYRLERVEPGRSVSLTRFDGYWRSRPYWDRAVFLHDADGRSRVDRVLSGEVDLADAPALEDLPRVLASGSARVVEKAGIRILALHLNAERRSGVPAVPRELRRAIALALDREALVREGLAGHGLPAFQLAPRGAFGFAPERPMPTPDPAAARRALVRARLAPAFGIPLVFTGRDRLLVAALVRQVQASGVRLVPREASSEQIETGVQDRTFPAYLLTLTYPNLDSSDALFDLHTRTADRRFGAFNGTGHSDPELDRLLEQSEAELDPVRRSDLLRQAMELAMSADVIIPLCSLSYLYALSTDIQWEGDPLGATLIDQIRRRRSAERPGAGSRPAP
jgi:peptide/nickel transport system substrate-binding protein